MARLYVALQQDVSARDALPVRNATKEIVGS